MEPLLSVRNLKTHFHTASGVLPVVDGVSFDIGKGGTLGIVGESGCGKSVTALSIMRLITNPPGQIVAGEVLFEGRDVLQMSPAQVRTIRGKEIAMVFQEPMTALNPACTVGYQITETLRLHQKLSKRAAKARAIALLHMVGIPAPDRHFNYYPWQMSGGMRQRVMIAIAVSCSPKLLIADEPTTALDVTIQAQIMTLMQTLRHDLATAIILITHDLSIIAELVDQVAVMYAGKLVECGAVRDLFNQPQHPYTAGLLAAIPKLHEVQERLTTIEGVVPNPAFMPRGCRFHPRCIRAQAICRSCEPQLLTIKSGHTVACWRSAGYPAHVGVV